MKAKNEVRKRCQTGDILDLPFKDSQFELVTALAVMEHIDKGKTQKSIKELLRVSSKYVFLQICVKDNPFEGEHFLLDPTHVNVENSTWWIKKFEELKLKVRFGVPRLGIFLLKKKD